MLPARRLPQALKSRVFGRTLYTVPALKIADENRDKGLTGLYTKEGLQKAWYDRAQHYVDKLNKHSDNTGKESSVESIVQTYYREPHKKEVYENASLLYNTQFAFECLAPMNPLLELSKKEIPSNLGVLELLKTPPFETDLDLTNVPANEELSKWIKDSFGSLLELKTLLINSAMGIKGDGFVWLVTEKLLRRVDSYESLFVLNTYGCGQPNSNFTEHLSSVRPVEEQNTEFVLFWDETPLIDSLEEANEKYHAKKKRLEPLLAIDASPKAYLHDFGVFGKREYLERVWESINWDLVAARMPKRYNKKSFF